MLTILVTGSDTGIGKTRVAATIGRLLAQPGWCVQFVKPVETGRGPHESGDADEARQGSGIDGASRFTLLRFPLPLAPLAAARAEFPEAADNPTSLLQPLLQAWQQLPPADLRIVEGAGGIAVPLDSDGRDWCDFAHAIKADRVVLVTPDRLGGINQGRLVTAYARRHPALVCGIWLNEVQPQPDAIRDSNRVGLADHPIWATQRFETWLPEEPALAIRHLAENRA